MIELPRAYQVLPKNEQAALQAWLTQFYPFQLDWVLDDAEAAISNKSRQIGISHSSAGLVVRWGVFNGEKTTIISKGELESTEVLDKAEKHARILERCGSRMARVVKKNAQEIRFASGGRIIALPSSGGRGFTGNVFLDEFAYQMHATKVWDAAAAVTMLGGKLRVGSTPNGVGNDFHNLWELALKLDSGWSTHFIPLQRAVDQGYPVDMAKCWRIAKGDPRLFDQFFNCSFLDGNTQYIPTDVIRDATSDELQVPSGEYYAGLDIGRDIDLTVLVVVRYLNGVRYVAHVEAMKRTDSEGLEAMVARAFLRFKLRRLCIDATGLGVFPAERIKQKHSERIDTPHRRPRVEPITFTPNVKEDLATGLYAAFIGETVKIPKTDKALPSSNLPAGTALRLRRDLASLRRVITSSGNVRYEAPRTAEGHADYAWALALALHACSGVNPMVEALKKRALQGTT